MQADNHRQNELRSSNQCIRNKHYGNSTFSQHQPVRLNRKRAGPCCFWFCKSKVMCTDFDDLNRGKFVPGRTGKRISYQKSTVNFGQQQKVPQNLGSSPKRQNMLAHRTSRDNLMSEDRWTNTDRTNRREDQIDDIVTMVVTWEALLPDGWREYAPKISNTIEKVYRRVRSLDLEGVDEKSCWQDESLYYQLKQYRISPHFMLQRNMNTGKDRKIRRKKVQVSSKAKRVRPRRVRSGLQGHPPSHSTALLEQKHPEQMHPEQKHPEQKHSTPGPQPKQRVKKRRKKRVKRRQVDSDLKHDLYERKHCGSTEDTTLTLNFNNYRNWQTAHVVSWLRILNFPQYCDIVQQKGIIGKQLLNVSITWLVTELKMTVEHATHIFGALEGIKSGFTEHGDEKVNSRLSSTSRESKFTSYDTSIDESRRESMVFKKVDGIMVGPRIAIPPPFDKTKMTPSSEGTSLYSLNGSQNLYLEQSRKSSIRSVAKSQIADRIQIPRGSKEQKNSLTNLIDEISLPKESSVHEIEEGNDLVEVKNMTKNNTEITKQVNSHGCSIQGGEETKNPLFGKKPSISSEDMTWKIHSSTESQSENIDIQSPSDLIFGGFSNSQIELFTLDKQSSNCEHAAQQREQRESITQSSLQSEVANRRKSVTLKLKHVDADCISDDDENVVADMNKQFDFKVTSERKLSKTSINTELENVASLSPFKAKVSSLDSRKFERKFSNTGESFLMSVENDDIRKTSSPSLIVRLEC